MKVLYKDKIVESFHFPFTEALSFSILIWTIWGLVEALYWNKLAPFLNLTNERVHPLIYVVAFLIYLTIALIVAGFAYSLVKWSFFTLEMQETPSFRAATLSLILAIFLLMVLLFLSQRHVFRFSKSDAAQYGLLALVGVISALAIFLLYRRASAEGFRIRRSGTTMFSVVVLSVLLSLVPFPIFSSGPDNENTTHVERKLDLKSTLKKLLASHYIQAFTPEGEKDE